MSTPKDVSERRFDFTGDEGGSFSVAKSPTEFKWETKLQAVAVAFFNDNKNEPGYPFTNPREQAEELRPMVDFVTKTFDDDTDFYVMALLNHAFGGKQ